MVHRFAVIFITLAIGSPALMVGEQAHQRDEMLRTRLDALEAVARVTSHSQTIGQERWVKTEFGASVRKGVKIDTDALEALLDPALGSVVFFEVKTTRDPKAEPQKVPRKTMAEALAGVKNCLQSIGSQLGPDLESIHGAFDPSSGVWRFAWQRRISGYPFPEETLVVAFEEAEALIVSMKDLRSLRDCPTEPLVGENTAISKARTHVRTLLPSLFGQDYDIAAVQKPTLMVAYPNNRHMSGAESDQATEPAVLSNPRLVYSFDITFKYTGTSELRKATPPLTIWVDAITGEITGGL